MSLPDNIMQFLAQCNTCDFGMKKAVEYNTLQEVWDDCCRADWMLQMLAATLDPADNAARCAFLVCATQCVRAVVKDDYEGNMIANLVELWACGKEECLGASKTNTQSVREELKELAGDVDRHRIPAAYALTTLVLEDAEHWPKAAAICSCLPKNADDVEKTIMQEACSYIVRNHYPAAPELPKT